MTETATVDEVLSSLVENCLNISEINNTQISDMARQEVNYQLLRLYVDSIPMYSGDPHTLGIFISSCENIINIFSDPTNIANPINNFILRAVIGKLTGRALILIGSRSELSSWLEIKQALQLSFGDQRNIDCLVQDLIVLRPHKSESPYNFGMRVQDSRSLIVAKINSINMIPEEKILNLKNYDDLALKTFLRGLNGQLQNNVRLRNPDSLEKAMSLVIEEENFMYAQQRPNTINSQTFHPYKRITPVQNNQIKNSNPKNFQYNPFRPPIHNQPPRQHNNQHFQYSPNQKQNFQMQHQFLPVPMEGVETSPFPRGPVNIQPRPVPPKKYFTNEQVFGKPTNVFKPGQNKSTYTPTPMSISTRNTNQFKKFKPNGPPKYTFEELHHLDNLEETEPNNQYYSNDYYENPKYNDEYSEYSENYFYSDTPDLEDPYYDFEQNENTNFTQVNATDNPT